MLMKLMRANLRTPAGTGVPVRQPPVPARQRPSQPALDNGVLFRRAELLGHQAALFPAYRPAAADQTKVVRRMLLEEAEEGLDPGELNIFRDWVEWALVRDGPKSMAALLADYTLPGLKGALSEYAEPRWRLLIHLFAQMARGAQAEGGHGALPMAMSDVILFEEAVRGVLDPHLAAEFMFTAGIKGHDRQTLIQMAHTYAGVVVPRGFPYPFEDQEQFAVFQEGLRKLVYGQLGLAPVEIRIQGSSLRRPDPGDIDVGIMVDGDTFEKLIAGLEANTPRDSKRMFKLLAKAREDGHINPYVLSFLTKPPARIFEIGKGILAAALQKDAGEVLKVQISVVRIGSKLDRQPSMAFH